MKKIFYTNARGPAKQNGLSINILKKDAREIIVFIWETNANDVIL